MKIKLTRSAMALASGESLEQFDKRTGGADPTEGILEEKPSSFFPDDNDEEEVAAGDDDFDETKYLPDADDVVPAGEEEEDGKPGWVDERAIEFASSYGLKDTDLGQFESFDDLRRYGRITDQKIAEQYAGKADDSKETKEEPKQESSVLERLKLLDRQKYVEAKYGEEELQLVDGLNSTIEAIREYLPSLAQQKAQDEQTKLAKNAEEFHSALDEVDPKLFGKAIVSGKMADLSDGFDRNRRQVRDTMERLAKGIAEDQRQRGLPVQIPPTRVLAQRAAAIFAGEAPAARTSKAVDTEAVSQQSRKRRPTSSAGRRGATKGTVQAGSPASEARQIAKHPAFQKLWKQTQRENGAE